MDSAIAPHLRCPRSQPARQPEGHVPAYPSWSAHLPEHAGSVVFANYGVQWKDEADERTAREYIAALATSLGGANAADHFDIARYCDEAGYETLVVLAYWLDPRSYDAWHEHCLAQGVNAKAGKLGRFTEVLTPEVRRVETLYSAPQAVAGIGKITEALSDEIVEHAYWGSARDRLPVSQTDALEPAGTIEIVDEVSDGNRVTVKGHDNVAIIRSGQDWSATKGEERRLYLERIAPPLRAGMDFLRDDGVAIGCYGNRFMQLVDETGAPLERTFGWSYWHSLADMEVWAASHPSHLAIFDTFNAVVVELNFQLDLQLSHEIYVVRAEDQSYSYENCHPGTGLLKLRTPGE
jgi:aldoxime dehydratase